MNENESYDGEMIESKSDLKKKEEEKKREKRKEIKSAGEKFYFSH